MAVLRSIEFLVDQLGCSLNQYLIQILASIIKTYPRSNLQYTTTANQTVPLKLGFFQEAPFMGFTSSNAANKSINYDNAYENSQLNSVVFDTSTANQLHLVVKDGLNFQSSYISCIKNLQNHILESFISLLSSMSSAILHQIFQEVILKCVFLQTVRCPQLIFFSYRVHHLLVHSRTSLQLT